MKTATAKALAECNEVVSLFRRVFKAKVSTKNPRCATNGEEFCLRSAIIKNELRGKPGCGLTGGSAQEELFKQALGSSIPRKFVDSSSAENLPDDADYGIMSLTGQFIPLSHKHLGGNDHSPTLALNWSKNKDSYKTTFRVHMVIVYFRTARGRWADFSYGVYVIPKTYLQKHITLKANNKSDSILDSKELVKALNYAKKQGLFLPLRYDEKKSSRYRVEPVWDRRLLAVS